MEKSSWETTAFKLRLEDYHISEETGFLLKDPLEILPANFTPWNELASALPYWLEVNKFRDEVEKMPILDEGLLIGHRQKRLAHLQLSMMASGYVWQEGPMDLPQHLPAQLAVPLWNLSQEIGVPPHIGHSNLFSSNWKRIDKNGNLDLENIGCLYSPSLLPDVLQFLAIAYRIEMDYGPAAKAIVDGVKCMAENNDEGLISSLEKIQGSLVAMKNTFSRIHELTKPDIFLTKLIPYFGGYGDQGSPFKDGLLFEGVSNIPIKAGRATGAQTCTIQTADAFLGINHDSECNRLNDTTRKVILPCYRKFIETLERFPSTKDYVQRSGNQFLEVAYDDCVSSLVNFRGFHIQIVAKYMIIAGIKERKKDKNMVNPFPKTAEGAYPIPLLKKFRKEALDQKCQSKD